MKLLLDENLPHRFRHLLIGHEVATTAYHRWTADRNGRLLRLAAEAGFDAILSKDAGLEYQHDLTDLPLSVVLLRSRSNHIRDLRPLVPALLVALEMLQPRTLVTVP